jgi:hypothetical protein
MKKKKCTICKHPKFLRDFNKRKRSKDGRQPACKECNAKHSKLYYRKNKKKHRAVVLQNKRNIQKRNRRFLWNYLLTHPCVDCGYANPIALEFDHVRGRKIAAISVLAGDSWSLEKIQDEIAKCDVRCAICHRIKTAHQLNWYKNIDKGS